MKKRTIAYLFMLLMLSQSCVIYSKTSVSLESAYDQGPVKMITKLGNERYYKKIAFEDNTYYGVNNMQRKTAYLPLDSTEISNIYLKDKDKSITRTVVLVLTGIPIILLIIGIIENNKNWSWGI